MRVLIDTNVVLDFILKRPAFFPEADELFVRLQNLDFDGYVSSITPVNVFYTTKKEVDKAAAYASVEQLLALTEVCRADKTVLRSALSLNFADFEDAFQCASATAEGLDAIVTRNAKDFRNSPIRVFSPSELLNILDDSITEGGEK